MNSNNNPSKRRKTHIPSDFKRCKAKVGKRVPQAANLTDTSFQSVSVQVKSQSIEDDNLLNTKKRKILFLLSGRGRSITELSQQLQHPAGTVRLSAVRGLISLIEETTQKEGGGIILATYLSVLLPIISKCACVDGDENVRSMGLIALQLLFSRTMNQNKTTKSTAINRDTNNTTANLERLWNSFVPLITAFVSSALHSLDRPTRLDGSRAVEIISQFLLFDYKIMATMLSAYITLLQDYGHYHPAGRNNNNSSNDYADVTSLQKPMITKSQKKSNSDKKNKRLILLQSLVSLLKAIKSEMKNNPFDSEGKEYASSEKIVIDGNSTVNNSSSLMLLASQRDIKDFVPLPTLNNIEEYFDNILSDFSLDSTMIVHASTNKTNLSESNLATLFSKLRDIFVEILERGTQMNTTKLSFGRTDLDELSLLLKSIHLLWKHFGVIIKQSSTSKIVFQLWNMMLHTIPIQSKSSNDNEIVATINEVLCFTVMEMETEKETEISRHFQSKDGNRSINRSTKWTKVLLDYLLPRLDANDFHSASTTMNVLARLLLKEEETQQQQSIVNDHYSTTTKTHTTVMNRITEIYFSSSIDGENDSMNITRSAGARKSVQIVTHLLLQHNDQEEANTTNTEKYSIIQLLPKYLVSYRNDFHSDSDRIVEILLRFAHRLPSPSVTSDSSSNNNDKKISNLMDTLRKDLIPIFVDYDKNEKSSIFQSYPSSLQRKVICLIVTLQSPPAALLQSLGKLCARAAAGGSSIPHGLASFILETMFLIRKTISIQIFLEFIITSIGVPKQKTKNNTITTNIDSITAFDVATQRASRILHRCGTLKVLPMIAEVISSWLVSSTKGKTSFDIIRFRICFLLVTVLAHDIQDFLKDIVPKLFYNNLIQSCIEFFKHCTWENGNTSELFNIFECSMIAFFKNEPLFLCNLVQEISHSVVEQQQDDSLLKVLNAMHEITQHPDHAVAIRVHANSWVEAVHTIVSKIETDDTISIKIAHKAQVVLTCLQLVVGSTNDKNSAATFESGHVLVCDSSKHPVV